MSFRNNVRLLATAGAWLLAAGLPATVRSAEAGPSAVTLRGFGTAGAVRSDEREADFVGGFFQPNGAGRTRRWSTGVDSRFGLQADARLSERLSGVVQVVAQQQYDNSIVPNLEWANLKYQITPDLDIRVGRTVTMPFLVSDSRLVGYGNTWVRPPQEVYGLIPITNKDGVDASYRMHAGDLTSTVRASYGSTSRRLPNSARVVARDYLDVSNTLEYGAATLRAAYSTGHVSLSTPSLDALVDGLSAYSAVATGAGAGAAGARAAQMAERYRFRDAPISVISLGGIYDTGKWMLMSEWASFNGHSILADSSAWYASAGYRIGAFTPYATTARLRARPRSADLVPLAGLPPALAVPGAQLNSGVTTLLSQTNFTQRSLSAGVRWDFARNMDLKVQLDHIVLDPGAIGRLGNPGPGFQPGGRVNAVSLALDFVF